MRVLDARTLNPRVPISTVYNAFSESHTRFLLQVRGSYIYKRTNSNGEDSSASVDRTHTYIRLLPHAIPRRPFLTPLQTQTPPCSHPGLRFPWRCGIRMYADEHPGDGFLAFLAGRFPSLSLIQLPLTTRPLPVRPPSTISNRSSLEPNPNPQPEPDSQPTHRPVVPDVRQGHWDGCEWEDRVWSFR
jgi:hypothetical protein